MKYRGATGGVVEVTTVVVVDIDMLLTFVLLIAIRKPTTDWHLIWKILFIDV